MTQPAFSRRIRALEEWLGTELFDRSSQPARLTAAGEWFRDTAHELMARVARVPGEARAVAEAHSTTLRFAATHALSFTFLTGWLRGLESRTTVGPITLVSDVFARCEAMLLESQVQFVMSHAHPQSSSELLAQDFPFVRVGSDMLIPVSAPDSAGRAALPTGACHAGLASAGSELQPGVRPRPHLARSSRRGARTLPCAERLPGTPGLGTADHGSGRPRDGVVAANLDRRGSGLRQLDRGGTPALAHRDGNSALP